ncbi:SEL1-like repeat protein [Aliamphritea ceti]|uniref:SEL1-like repeat protein n=1 Tax=Aliamphritea ceti TaxID=1524258 RepID=UPI0021C398B6|nr:SEL1-like repeat protein [Aliamphritea ceti]
MSDRNTLSITDISGLVILLLLSVSSLSGCRFGWLPLQEKPPEQVATTATISSAEYYYRLGLKHTRDGEEQDLVAARDAFRQAAEKGHVESQYLLALAYFNGQEGNASQSQGFYWLEQAAQGGQAEAQFRLGGRYLNGIGVAGEESWGVQWIARAADQGHAQAQYQLGVAYAAGLGWSADLVEAWSWLALAERNGEKSAAVLLSKIESRLSVGQLAEAKVLRNKWRRVSKENSLPRAQVRFIQHSLNQLGFAAGNADGWVGPVTRQAIGNFRQSYNVSGTGSRINTGLLKSLRQALLNG